MARNILVIEDSAPVRGLVRLILEQADFSVREAASPEEAILAASESGAAFELVICDLHLQGGSGFETANRVRELRPAVKILYMSGHDIQPPLSGGTGFILKPFRPEDLLEKIHAMIG